MQTTSFIYEIFTFATSFFGWRDCCEIAFLSTIVYYFSSWLSTDTTKNLLGTFYIYLILLYVSYTLQLTTITIFLLYFSPIAAILLIIMHQELLQKNFITYKKISLINEINEDWLETIIQVCLQTISKNKSINIIIEQHDSLKDYFQIPCKLNTPLSNILLSVLIDSNWYDDNKLIWLSSTGTLFGINTQCKKIKNEFWFDSTIQNYEQWKQDAFALSKKTDALFICITPTIRTFTVAYQGKVMEQLQGSTVIQLIKKILVTETKKGTIYGYTYKTNNKQI